VALLVDAFHDSPLFVTAFPSKRTRDRVLRTLFDALVDDTARFGGLHIASCDTVIVGALLWYGPGGYPMTLSRILRQLPWFLAIVAKSTRGGRLRVLSRRAADMDHVAPAPRSARTRRLPGRRALTLWSFTVAAARSALRLSSRPASRAAFSPETRNASVRGAARLLELSEKCVVRSGLH
jgi:hypothetical protein